MSATATVTAVTEQAAFEEHLNLKCAGAKLVVVDFHAQWCGPCKTIAPEILKLAQQLDDVVFLKVDVDEADQLAAYYNISCMPTFLFFKNGAKVLEFSGANLGKLKENINTLK